MGFKISLVLTEKSFTSLHPSWLFWNIVILSIKILCYYQYVPVISPSMTRNPHGNDEQSCNNYVMDKRTNLNYLYNFFIHMKCHRNADNALTKGFSIELETYKTYWTNNLFTNQRFHFSIQLVSVIQDSIKIYKKKCWLGLIFHTIYNYNITLLSGRHKM